MSIYIYIVGFLVIAAVAVAVVINLNGTKDGGGGRPTPPGLDCGSRVLCNNGCCAELETCTLDGCCPFGMDIQTGARCCHPKQKLHSPDSKGRYCCPEGEVANDQKTECVSVNCGSKPCNSGQVCLSLKAKGKDVARYESELKGAFREYDEQTQTLYACEKRGSCQWGSVINIPQMLGEKIRPGFSNLWEEGDGDLCWAQDKCVLAEINAGKDIHEIVSDLTTKTKQSEYGNYCTTNSSGLIAFSTSQAANLAGCGFADCVEHLGGEGVSYITYDENNGHCTSIYNPYLYPNEKIPECTFQAANPQGCGSFDKKCGLPNGIEQRAGAFIPTGSAGSLGSPCGGGLACTSPFTCIEAMEGNDYWCQNCGGLGDRVCKPNESPHYCADGFVPTFPEMKCQKNCGDTLFEQCCLDTRNSDQNASAGYCDGSEKQYNVAPAGVDQDVRTGPLRCLKRLDEENPSNPTVARCDLCERYSTYDDSLNSILLEDECKKSIGVEGCPGEVCFGRGPFSSGDSEATCSSGTKYAKCCDSPPDCEGGLNCTKNMCT